MNKKDLDKINLPNNLDDVIDEYSDLKIIEASNGISLIEDTESV